ncbi:TIGR01777 family oxidoreductase [Peribacillus psychrosaccharolyticus]|uniref:TIGR01777 family oxidoreductase n=1 Tax=Peribacillus psychrosaccharolyticus TaxID=1407 RepID=A0A974NR43_PERPY|nr:TIGR01777 family oxidoreductase [Peribacillus psychrosaccharolyticus]MEC2057184.1 TIGR01777 family oxidoreductase [Peribacillus psychrosaccharolyticus]MED3745107.1 TIGR01777 family oxidoreductase [Peribacillus psychrosaccharolyticus]QQT02287.1 TIGR01777 family oxidoreductase [Peribacillus psychrosaccharolyticus]
MKIAIAGGSGFVGTALIDALLKEEHDLYILTRNPEKYTQTKNLHYIKWLNKDAVPEKNLKGLDIFINLAGESLNSGRWTKNRKRRIVESRIETTKEMNRILGTLEQKISLVINASAIGYYGTSEQGTFTEDNETTAKDFLSRTVQLWEKEARKARAFSHRVVFTRFGLILGQTQGALPTIVLPYKLFAGGTIGNGSQILSWIHIQDVAGAILFCIHHSEISGPVNFTAPQQVTMREFGHSISKTINRPHWFPVPAFVLKVVLGEMSILVLEGQKVHPQVLEKSHYPFRYATLNVALNDLLKK